jgi:hypothetical protein
MIPAMQVGLFFQQAQTIRNFLAAALGVPENSRRWMQSAGPKPLLASAQQYFYLHMSTTLNLVSEMERIANALGTEEGGTMKISLSTVADKIARNLGVKTDEVAILALSTRWRHLHFLVPEALKNVGFVPLSSNTALAARTARDSRPEIENNFAAAKHATVFEGVKIGSEPTEAIQKMISAPILLDGKVIGIIQVSRKGPNPQSAGPDFTADDLGKILAFSKPLGKFLRHVAGE